MLCKDIHFAALPPNLHTNIRLSLLISSQNVPISALTLCKTSLRFRCGSGERGLNGYDRFYFYPSLTDYPYFLIVLIMVFGIFARFVFVIVGAVGYMSERELTESTESA